MEPGRAGKLYLTYILLIVFSIFGYGIQKICCFTLFPDEFGYWASAARLAGYDWSDMAGLGSYYSFGYGLLLFPLMKLIPDGILLYRGAVALNMILMCAAVFLIQGIVRELFPETDPVQRVFISGIAALYPPWIVYMQMTMAEALLTFLFVLITRMLITLAKRPRPAAAAGLAAALVYLYCVHMRTVGVVLACALTVGIWSIKNPAARKQARLFFFTLALAGVLAFFMKQYVLAEVFGQAGENALKTNDYGGLWIKIREIFSREGALHLAMGIIGKVFYLGLAGFGLFFRAAGWCIKRLTDKEKSVHRETACFLLLSAVFEILICTVYMVKKNNIDSLIYGRYNDFLMPVLMAAGACALIEGRRVFRVSAWHSAALGAMALVLALLVKKEGREGIRAYMVVGISYLLPKDSFDPYLYFGAAWLLGTGFIFFTALLLWLGGRKEGRGWLFGGILALEAALGLYAGHRIPYHYNETHFIDKAVAETIRERSDGAQPVIYLKEDETKYIDAIQMMLGPQPIKAVEADAFFEAEPAGDFVITVSWTAYRERLEEMFDRNVETNSFILFYNK